MSIINQPTSSQRVIPVSGDFTIRFAPGQPMTNQVFPDPYDVFEFIRTRIDSAITLYIDLSEWGVLFDAPDDIPYNFERVFLDGFFFPAPGGSIPRIRFSEGTTFSGNFLRMRDVNFEFLNTSQTIWEPTEFTRIETERAAGFINSGGGLFLDYTNSNNPVLQYSGGPGTGTENPANTPIFKIGSGQTLLAYGDADTRFDTNTVEGPADSTLDFRFWNLSQLQSQPNFLGTMIKSSFNQSGDTFPEETYPGKLYQKIPEDFIYARGAGNLTWRRQDEAPFVDYVDALAVNSVGGSFVTRHNFNYPFVTGRVYEIEVTYWWNYGATANNWRSQLLINGVQQGQIDNGGTRYFHAEAPQEGGTGTVAQKVAGTNSTQRTTFQAILRYTASSTGSLPVVLRWGPEANQDAAIWKSLIRIRRVL